MTNRTVGTSPRLAALIAGSGILVILVLAVFANFSVLQGLIDPDDAATTFANIADSELMFRLGLVSFLLVFLVDVVVAWALYIVFRVVNQEVSLLTAWLRILYAVFLGVALIFFFIVLQLVSGVDYLAAFKQTELEGQVALGLDAFTYTWQIGLFFFGIHLILLGYLVFTTRFAPQVLGLLLMIAGAAYSFDALAHALLSNYADYETLMLLVVAVPSFIGETSLAIWLLVRGGRQTEAAVPPLDDSLDNLARIR